MRPLPLAAPAAPPPDATPALPVSYPPKAAADRDLIDHLAVIAGVCEALSDSLAASRHGELARVGALAAARAAGLACARGAAPPAHAPANDAAPAPAGPVVLIVEDDPVLLELMTGAFRRAGFTAEGAKNGREGVRRLAALKPALMVTDIVMPEMEGIGAILEARRQSPATRVIAISGGGQYGRSQDFLGWAAELGADEVLAKPFRVSSLITAARVLLDRAPATPSSNAFN